MSQLITIHSFRGGTGKSNSTANLASLMALRGKRIGIIDTDIQSPGIHVLFNLDVTRVEFALNDYLWGNCPIEKAAHDVTYSLGELPPEASQSRIFLIPSSVRSGEIARVLREGYDVARLNDGIQRVVRELELDFLFIDTHPGVNEETLLSIAISDKFLLVMRPDNQDFQGTAVTVELAHRLDVKEILLIVNKVPPGTDQDLLKAKIETSYRAPVIGMLPLNGELASLGSSSLFAMRYPEHPITQTLNSIVDRLLE